MESPLTRRAEAVVVAGKAQIAFGVGDGLAQGAGGDVAHQWDAAAFAQLQDGGAAAPLTAKAQIPFGFERAQVLPQGHVADAQLGGQQAQARLGAVASPGAAEAFKGRPLFCG